MMPPPPPGAWDDENTENIAVKDAKAKPEGAKERSTDAAALEVATRATAPMTAIDPPGEAPPAVPAAERVTTPLKAVSRDEVAKARATGDKKKPGGKKTAGKDVSSSEDPTVESRPAVIVPQANTGTTDPDPTPDTEPPRGDKKPDAK
jgi:hypothetical protein